MSAPERTPPREDAAAAAAAVSSSPSLLSPRPPSAARRLLAPPPEPIDWNALVKPIVFVGELVLGAVVAFGTADQLIFVSVDGATRCALDNSMATCAAVIAIGSLCVLGALAVLWRRLLAAFASDFFAAVDEAVFCCLISVGWLVVASIITRKIRLPPQAPASGTTADIIMMRNTITAFAWLNAVLYFASALLALFVSDRDPPKFHAYLSPGPSLAPSRRESMLNVSGRRSSAVPPNPPAAQSRDDEVRDSPQISSSSNGASSDSIGGSTGDSVTPPDLVREILGRAGPAAGQPSQIAERLRDAQDVVTPAAIDTPGDASTTRPSAASNPRNDSTSRRRLPVTPSTTR